MSRTPDRPAIEFAAAALERSAETSSPSAPPCGGGDTEGLREEILRFRPLSGERKLELMEELQRFFELAASTRAKMRMEQLRRLGR